MSWSPCAEFGKRATRSARRFAGRFGGGTDERSRSALPNAATAVTSIWSNGPSPMCPLLRLDRRYVPDKLDRPASSKRWWAADPHKFAALGGAFSFLVRLALSPLEPNNPSQINWHRPGRSTVLDRAALAAQVRPKGGARSKPRLASVRALTSASER
jgi:hypothetical protein